MSCWVARRLNCGGQGCLDGLKAGAGRVSFDDPSVLREPIIGKAKRAGSAESDAGPIMGLRSLDPHVSC